MFRLTAEFTDDHFDFVLHRDDAEVLVTSDPIGLALRMLYVVIENPLRLIDAARQWASSKSATNQTIKRRGRNPTAPVDVAACFARSIIPPMDDPSVPPAGNDTQPRPACPRCDSTGWVCEAHPDQPWENSPMACGCGATGEPCKTAIRMTLSICRAHHEASSPP